MSKNDLVELIKGAGRHLLVCAANGAAEAVLEEVQGAVREVDRRITKARGQTSSRQKEDRRVEVEAEFIED